MVFFYSLHNKNTLNLNCSILVSKATAKTSSIFSYSVIRFLTSTFFVFPAAIYANRK